MKKIQSLGTSNWSGDYFTTTAGVGFIVNQTMSGSGNIVTVQQQLVSIYERDWNSTYAKPLESQVAMVSRTVVRFTRPFLDTFRLLGILDGCPVLYD